MAFTALAAGVSGLQSFTEGVGVIADNITNVNTIGYKETRARFSTLVTETAALSSYSPGGVRAFSDTLVSKQGLLQPSASATDLSVDGNGFFVVRDGTGAEDTDGEVLYTRAGSFTQDSRGFLKNTAGLYLMGWPVAADGSITTNQNDLSELSPININELNSLGSATQNVSLRANVNASATDIDNTTYSTGDLAAGTISPELETNIQVYDSLGRQHTVVVAAAKTDAGANTWQYELYFDDDSVLSQSGADPHTDGLIGSGQLIFNDDGSIDLASTTMNDITGTAVDLSAGESLTFTYAGTADGATVAVEGGSIAFDFGTDGESDGFSQTDNSSNLLSSAVDGANFENVNGVSIGEDGSVTAIFDNGLTLTVFKLPVATFQNADGLTRRQGNAFGLSDLSGDPSFQQAGRGGAGSISPNSLEQSTVDLANEFSELIKVQRAFSASTRIITTSDEILEELTRL
ncbi:flagellar hook protein FlgE [Kordiimonas lacus]|uniref:Flagellar hook protein FlgE n=1 Tax=Kordiimonas lacus TaxID=637679 RepID=A0A1G6YY07_9PROT|nr:flagellar hook-basal body complex protein [Kordiimonas lacus]SDD94525.1 flagellar hook protein FlgE [Kordiimonas lacus]